MNIEPAEKATNHAPLHKANLMDIEPAEKATNHAPLLITAINESELSGDELSAYMLVSFNKTLGCPSNHLADLKKAKAPDNHTGTSLDSSRLTSVTHHLGEISLSAEQQAVNRKVLNSEFLIVFIHYIHELYSPRDSDVILHISKHEAQSLRLQSTSIAIVGSIQQTKVNILLKVLFDSRSDKMIFKRSSLPQGIEPSTGKKQKVSTQVLSLTKTFCLQTLLSQSFRRHHNTFQVQFVQ
jgi:hypothetical protein